MSSNGGDNNNREVLNYLFILIAVFFFCCSYCFRRTRPAEDPANDPIGGWIPNPTNRQTASLEEKRKLIESKLIVRKVLEGDDNASVGSGKSWYSNSDMPIATIVSAFATRKSGQTRKMKFSKPLQRANTVIDGENMTVSSLTSTDKVVRKSNMKRSHSTPADMDQMMENHAGFVNDLAIDPLSKKAESVRSIDDSSYVFDLESSVSDYGEDDDMANEESERQVTSPTRRQDRILHRRKTDVVIRRLASTLRKKPQNYSQPTTCDICLLDYEAGEEVAWSPNDACMHAFHKECIMDWLLRNPKCPLCREDYLYPSTSNNTNSDGDALDP